MPFLTFLSRSAVCCLLVAAIVVGGERRSFTDDGGLNPRGLSTTKSLDQNEGSGIPAEITQPPPAALLKYAVKLRAKDTRFALASGVNTPDGIVTCAHVVDGYSEFTVDCDGESATAKVVSIDEAHDLALLSVTWSQPHSEAVLTDKNPTAEEQLTSVGRQKDGTFSIELHSMQKIENSEYLYSNPPQEGRSGSGVFNSEGKLVGIMLGKIVDIEPYIGRAALKDDVAKLMKVGGSKSNLTSAVSR